MNFNFAINSNNAAAAGTRNNLEDNFGDENIE